MSMLKAEGKVISGPFRGMIYPPSDSCYSQKVLGTYEKELWPAVEAICRMSLHCVVDIGAAEGFYVCGFARRVSNCHVIAFEAEKSLHPRLREIAGMNGVLDRVDIRGHCGIKELCDALTNTSRSCLICDVEGFEAELLDPERVPQLCRIPILVEVHDHLREGVTQILRSRFGPTHSIQSIDIMTQTIADLPPGWNFPSNWQRWQ